jgi:hypothetical protein
MRLALLALLLGVLLAVPARADRCAWTVVPNISAADVQLNSGSGTSFPSSWAWQYILHASPFMIYGNMSANTHRATTNLGASASGNATYKVTRMASCVAPQEDIEGVARNEFTARAMINDDTYAQAYGSQRIKAQKMDLDCHACGGVESTSKGHGGGNSGSFTIQAYNGGPSVVIYWSKGGVMEKAFQDADGGAGGRSPETIVCQTNLNLSLSVGWWHDAGEAQIKDSKSELTVWGTCDGFCGVVVPVIEVSVGY